MLPVLPPDLLDTHEHFARLYRYITSKLLYSDGSSQQKGEALGLEKTRAELQEAREQWTKDTILIRALREVATSTSQTSPSHDPLLSSSTSVSGPTSTQPQAQPRIHTRTNQRQAPTRPGERQPKYGYGPTKLERRNDTNQVGEEDTHPRLLPEQQELVYFISEYISSCLFPSPSSSSSSSSSTSKGLPADAHELLSEELAQFEDQLPLIAQILSNHLTNGELVLRNIALPPPQPVHSTASGHVAILPGGVGMPPTHTTAPERTSLKPHNHHSPTSNPIPEPAATLIESAQAEQHPLLHSRLEKRLSEISGSLLRLRATQSALLEHKIRHLELHTHGTQARYLSARTGFLSSVAEGVECKARLSVLQNQTRGNVTADTRPRPHERSASLTTHNRANLGGGDGDRNDGKANMATALSNAVASLSAEGRRLRDREEELTRVLAEYGGTMDNDDDDESDDHAASRSEGTASEEVMRTLGKKYREVEEEIGIVREDVSRLERELSSGPGASRFTFKSGVEH